MIKFILGLTLSAILFSCTSKEEEKKKEWKIKLVSEELCSIFDSRFFGAEPLFSEATYRERLSEYYLLAEIMNQRRIEQDTPIDSNNSSSIPDTTILFGKLTYVAKLINLNNKNEANNILKEIINSNSNNSQITLWAWNDLRELGDRPKNSELEGIVLEIPPKDSVCYLAIFRDKTVVYINQYGIEEKLKTLDSTSTTIINETILKCINYLNNNKLVEGRNKLKTNKLRFSFLTTDGIFQIEKSYEELSTDLQEQNEGSENSLAGMATRIIPIIINQPPK